MNSIMKIQLMKVKNYCIEHESREKEKYLIKIAKMITIRKENLTNSQFNHLMI